MSIPYNKFQVRIRLENLCHNYRVFRKLHENVIAVIKSDAYGHGLTEVYRALAAEGARTFAVGYVNEAVALRQAGCAQQIVALLGPVDDADYAALAEHEIVAAHGHMAQLERTAREAAARGEIKISLKFDTGMRRLGFRPDAVGEVVDFLRNHPLVKPVMATSHLAQADEPDNAANVLAQAKQFQIAVDALREAGYPVEANLSNSAASMAYDACHYDSLRLGISLYGGNPFVGTAWEAQGSDLRPAMEVSTPVLQMNALEKGESVSYGWTYTARQDSVLAVVGAGYADNYSRSLSNVGAVNIAGQRAPIVGRVCMQMCMVDVSNIISEGLDVCPGDRVWLLGGPGDGTITPDDLAGWWGTITYEVFCLLGMNPRTYI